MDNKTPGKTTLTPEVIFSIVKMATLNIDGVHSFAKIPIGINSIFKPHSTEGIKVEIEDGVVYADLYVNLKNSYNVREVSRNIQTVVTREVFETVGFEVGFVNIHIEDIIY